ncbi:transmembrane 6 superfamily member 1-like [Elysia marginata]|uniref:Transmembrane 6 superfamily member 1-like n=1 Tax=Elysia marginata TaxID=1093978 RepID=A0AAV4GNZ5_9GAST|nr:transmembrane 6 superfamily member 1-like [Elysia marginata]
MVALFFNRLSYREVGLYWAGSILNSMIVLLPGAVTGDHPVKLSILLSTPSILLPIIAAVKLLHERPPQARSFVRHNFLFLLQWRGAFNRPYAVRLKMFN